MMSTPTVGIGAQVSACGPPNLGGTTVSVSLSDRGMGMGMMGSSGEVVPMFLRTDVGTVSAGCVTFVATNNGWRTHELVVLPLSPAANPGSRSAGFGGKVSEAGRLGEASNSCRSGAGGGIAPGSSGWVSLRLIQGRYELVCNEPNHYLNGMRQELDVTA